MLTLAAAFLSASAARAAASSDRTVESLQWRSAGVAAGVSGLVVDAATGREYASTWTGEVLMRPGPGTEWMPTADLPRSVAGETLRIALDPRDVNVVYASFAGCDGILNPNPTCHGALYRTRDGGASWTRVADGAYAFAFVDPASSATIYASIATDPVPAPGILVRSKDGAATWRELPLPTYSLPTSLAIHPDGSLVVGTDIGGLFVSGDRGETWAESQIDSTHDPIAAIAIDPSDSSRLFAGTQAGILRSLDHGASWSRVLDGDGVSALAAADGAVYAGGYAIVYRSDDGGDSLNALPLPDGATLTSLVADAPRNVLLVGTGTGVMERDLARPTRSLPPR